jgi:hypothetical protein
VKMITRKRATPLVVLVAALFAVASYGVTALANSAASELPPTWHVHDCGLPESVNPCGGQHKKASFFPTILGESNAAYVADPAECPNATDKSLLPSADESGSDVLRAGVCMTSTRVIELRTVPVGTSGPDGWQSIAGPEAGFITYYLLTAR